MIEDIVNETQTADGVWIEFSNMITFDFTRP